MKKIAYIAFATLVLPFVTFAQAEEASRAWSGSTSSGPQLRPLAIFVANLTAIVNTAIPLLIALALLTFFWGLVRYLWKAGGSKGEGQSKNLMIWGLIALFVMVSVWGIINLAQGAFGITGNERVPLPCVTNTQGGGCN
ncbi:hypothetical protein H7X87_04210 [Acetobacteraceae bacterium]|nr:hypothetical protein [Candidatus Parcubacteria bacterium]